MYKVCKRFKKYKYANWDMFPSSEAIVPFNWLLFKFLFLKNINKQIKIIFDNKIMKTMYIIWTL